MTYLTRTLIMALTLAALGCAKDAEPPTAAEVEPALGATAAHTLAFRQVAAGDGHTCGVTTKNVAYCWGADGGGELGIGSPESCLENPCTRPRQVVGGLAFQDVSAASHTCGVTIDHRLFCWGYNFSGQLGDGTNTNRARPVRIARGLAFRQVSAGRLHTCGVTTSDVAYCWGHNQAGELGDGTTNETMEPVQVARGLAFREVSAGNQFACGVTTDDVAYCWGMNTYGQLGQNSDTGPESCFTGDNFNPCSTRPIRVVRRLAFAHVTAGENHACGVTTDSVVYCWGANSSGQLGRGTSTGPELCFGTAPCSTKPVPAVGGLSFGDVDSGMFHTCGVTTGGVVYCWGANGSGELGIGSKTGPETCVNQGSEFPCSTKPVRVVGEIVFESVQAGTAHSCGVKNNNHVAFCWGDNTGGQVGDGTTQTRPRPRRVADAG